MRSQATRWIFAWLALAAVSCGCVRSFGSSYPDLPTNYRLALLQTGRFRAVEQVRGLPAVETFCFGTLKVAGPTEAWSVGCTPMTPDEPFTHMAWAATDGTFWIVAWEHGGIVYDGDVALIRLDSTGKAELLWGRTVNHQSTKALERRPPTSFKAFQEALDR